MKKCLTFKFYSVISLIDIQNGPVAATKPILFKTYIAASEEDKLLVYTIIISEEDSDENILSTAHAASLYKVFGNSKPQDPVYFASIDWKMALTQYNGTTAEDYTDVMRKIFQNQQS